MSEEKLWILKSKGAKSAFGGNNGYADELERFYLFDTTVKNHDKIRAGDSVLLVDKHFIKGSAVIERIEISEGIPKQRFRCPDCGTQEFYSRASVIPRYKCRKKHEFEDPDPEDITVTQYRAHYADSFKPAAAKLSVKTLEGYYIKRNIYYSIQQAELSFITGGSADSSIQRSMPRMEQVRKRRKLMLPAGAYQPGADDNRSFLIRKVSVRPSQDVFRSDLFQIYGTRCMLTGCDVAAAIEASHICPYRGESDNHPENGILLRRDLHALYDENLIGIDPEELTIRLSKALRGSVYEHYAGRLLCIPDSTIRPSRAALNLRWQGFLLQESG
ncbi:HNH endonuclease signature motif containing protein [uncultured Pedobacter sp.]|uniref:HNH endonuclease signature motif containing protein n=1 Tax=uncultured Pedobacter sp. TaxID=246139 RepID=UPI0025CD73EC|nr:HNH endonuclease signature motif containing protein [uncultured Pedobacter sp.]